VVGELTESVGAFLSTSRAEAKARSGSDGFISITHEGDTNILRGLTNGHATTAAAITNLKLHP